MMLDKNIQKLVDQLVEGYRPEKVILFGSFVTGHTHKWSDVDLVAIKKTDKSFYNRIGEASAILPHDLPIDIIVYTPEEFEEMCRDNYFVKNEILGKGKVVYEQS